MASTAGHAAMLRANIASPRLAPTEKFAASLPTTRPTSSPSFTMRVAVSYNAGHSEFGQFFRNREDYWDLGLSFDF